MTQGKPATLREMPLGQVNAHLGPDLVMRAGLPHTGGQLTRHAFDQGYPVMVSASAFWNAGSARFKIPEMCNLMELDLTLDSAGYTAMKLWQARGAQPGMAGVFPWTYAQYVELAASLGVSWWSQPDLCCEPDIATDQEAIDYRVRATATLLEGTLRVIYAWQEDLSRTCSARTVANMITPPVPVLQGWSADDYKRSLDLLLEVWNRWTPWLDQPRLIGVGSMCRRTMNHPSHGVYAILQALEGYIPAGTRLHLFGVKGACLSDIKMMDCVASADSMAYDFGARVKAREGRFSNSMQHRTAEMTRWMAAAADRLRPGAGDQFRLNFSN